MDEYVLESATDSNSQRVEHARFTVVNASFVMNGTKFELQRTFGERVELTKKSATRSCAGDPSPFANQPSFLIVDGTYESDDGALLHVKGSTATLEENGEQQLFNLSLKPIKQF